MTKVTVYLNDNDKLTFDDVAYVGPMSLSKVVRGGAGVSISDTIVITRINGRKTIVSPYAYSVINIEEEECTDYL